MYEKYVACMIIGHGGMLTLRNDNFSIQNRRQRTSGTKKIKWKHEETERRMQPKEYSIMPKIIDLPMNISLCTFSAPTETCAYPDTEVIALKEQLLHRLSGHSEDMNDEIFQNILYVSQRTQPIGFTYSSDEWAPHFSKKPEYTERWIHGNQCINKKFTDCHEAEIDCGIYVIQNNIGIENGSIIHYGDGILFSELFDYYANEYDVNKMYILDTTCSVVYNPEMNAYITDKNIINNIFKHALKFIRGGKKIKNKNKKRKNKTRKIKNKK